MRRKGERKIVREIWVWPDTPIAQCIARGSTWFNACVSQYCTPYLQLAKLTGIPFDRISEIDQINNPTPVEMEALAKAWYTSPTDLFAAKDASDAALTDDRVERLDR